MELKRIVAAGCSFVEGSNILDKEEKGIGKKFRASKILADRFCTKEINVAVPGSGNSYIINKLMETLLKIEDLTGTFVMIGLSGITRQEEYIKSINKVDKVRNFHLYDILVNKDSLSRRAKMVTGEPGNEDAFYNYIEFKTKYLFNLDYEKIKLRNQLLLLDGFLKFNNIPYVIFNSIEDNIIDVKDRINYLSFLDETTDELDDTKVKRRSDFYGREAAKEPNVEDTFQHFLQLHHYTEYNNTYEIEDRSPYPPYGKYFCGSHPSPYANEMLADKIEEYIETNFNYIEPKVL